MRSFEAFKILAHDARAMEESSTWSPPTISRLFELVDENGRGIRKYAGHSTEVNGKETFFVVGGKEVGHSIRTVDNLRTLYDAEGHKVGHEVEGGAYHAEHRHVHVHKHEARQAHAKGNHHTR